MKEQKSITALDLNCLKVSYILNLMEYLQTDNESYVYNLIDRTLFDLEKRLVKLSTSKKQIKKKQGLVNYLRGYFIDWKF